MVHAITGPVEQRVADLVGVSYGRLLALLAAPTRDIAAAEDALADALERALTTWRRDGVPTNPEGWIVTVARNRMRDRWKSAAYRTALPLDEIPDAATESEEVSDLPDRRLELMLVCAHPAIAADIHTPLMLQTVLGVDAAAVAGAFAVEPATMAQRLVRAKRRIRDAGIPFTIPGRDQLAHRLPAVLEAVYGAYAVDWQRPPDGALIDTLSAEAMHLALLLAELLPDEPEAVGLAALVCLSEARRPARQGPDGEFVPLDDQDAEQWDPTLIARGEELLGRAHALGRPGRFQYEAAIQSAHCSRRSGIPVEREAIRRLHRALLRVAPSLGAAVAAAAVDGEIDGPDAGLAALAAIEDPAVERFQPAWSTRAHLLAAAGRSAEAVEAYRRAITLTPDDGIRMHLAARLAAIE